MAENKNSLFRVLMLINNKRLTVKAMQLFEKENLPLRWQFAAHGTANSEMMDILGLGGVEKDAMITVLPKSSADKLLRKLSDELELTQKNTGIAYTLPLTGISSLFMKLSGQNEAENESSKSGKEIFNMSEIKYSIVAVTVNQGYCEDVMNAARSVGAKGGTVFHNNCIVNESSKGFWGCDFDEEKETVLIITENEKKLDIMKAISDACGICTEAKGIVLSMPIDNIMGIN